MSTEKNKSRPGVKWTLEEALPFIRLLEGHVSPRYHIGLVGSVLIKGSSTGDLDILVLPHSSEEKSLEEVHTALASFGMNLRAPANVVKRAWRSKGSIDEKYVEVWSYEAKKVDVFYSWVPEEANAA